MAAAVKTAERHLLSLEVTSHVGEETPVDQCLLSDGLRLIVQKTFFEVVEQAGSEELEVMRRAHSAPVRRTASQDEAVDEVKRPECALGVATEQEVVDVQGNNVPKTTVVIRNIATDYTRDQLVALLDVDFRGCYNFLYMPIDFVKRANFGYAFVNLSSTENADRFFAHFDGFSSWGVPHDGQATVGWSWNQGLEEHIERYRNSPVMHESMQDECKPIVLEFGVRVDFPPPTKKVPHLRRLRTRCGSRGRGVSSSQLGAIYGSQLEESPAPAGPSPLLAGLLSASDGVREDASMMTSPLFAGLKRVDDVAGSRASGKHNKKAQVPWADLQDDVESECSTFAPSSIDGHLSSDAYETHSESPHDGSPSTPWSRSMLADGLVAVPEEEEEDDLKHALAWAQPGTIIEVVGTYPSGGHAMITEINGEEGTFRIQLMRDGQLTRRRRTIKCKHARLLQNAEAQEKS
jgi:hypothetical protein